MDKITNPHDRLVRETLSKKDIACDFFKNYLPAHVLDLIDLDSLEISKDTFIENDLKEYYSDLLYKVSIQENESYLYLLLEHKSYKDNLIHLQLLEYMLKIWKMHIKQHGTKQLPIIIPLVLYHGRSKWKHGLNLSSMLSGPHEKLAEYIPDYNFILYDLTAFSDKDIKGTVIAKTVLLLLKHIFDDDITKKLPEIFSFLNELLDKETGLQYLETLLRYLVSTVEDITADDIKGIISDSITKEKEDLIMTLAEKWKNEGFEKGIQQGIFEAIELGLDIKFGDKSLEMLNIIREIKDINKLKAIKGAIKLAKSADELKKFC